MTLPALLSRTEIRARLLEIFPDGVRERDKCVRDAAAATVFAALYVGAIEGTGRWLGPVHVVRMNDERAALDGEVVRLEYGKKAVLLGPSRWYQENSREQVRDEVLRQGLILNNAVLERPGIPTTSGLPRYCLRADFAALFDPSTSRPSFLEAAEQWRKRHLSPAALARMVVVKHGASVTADGVVVTFPNGETRRMAPGPSSEISRRVIEDFAPRFLADPAVLWLSESGAKVVSRDDRLAASLKLEIEADRNLPDIILVDLGKSAAEFLLVFVEVVATDGPMTPERVTALTGVTDRAGYTAEQVVFVTAYLDRADAAFRKTVASLSWNGFVWFAAEPDHLLQLHDSGGVGGQGRRTLRELTV